MGDVSNRSLIVVEMTDAELLDFEWIEEGKPYREWLIPAEVINPRIRSLEYLDEYALG